MPLTPETWLDQVTVNATTTGSQNDPEVIQLANGNILVSWTTDDAGGLGSPAGVEIFGQIFDPLGNPVGAELRLNNASTADIEQNSHIAALPGGGFVVVYHDFDIDGTGGSNIRLEEYDANGASVTESPGVVIDSFAPADPNYRNPRVAVSSATSVLIVYEEVTAGVSGIYGKIYDTTTDTYSAQLVFMTGGGSGGTTLADVAVLSNGSYVMVANRGDTDNSLTYRVVNSAGAGGGSAFVIGTNTNTFNDREATVTALTGGGFVIAWTNTDTNDTDIEFRVYDNAGTPISGGFAGSDGATDSNNESQVIALADGSFVIAWDDDDSPLGIDVQHFSATGGQLGSVFTVSANNVNSISGVGLADGRMALVWDVSGSEISMEILDTRDAVNATPTYTTAWQVATAGDDVFTQNNGALNVSGGAGNDTITEGTGGTNFFGNDGNDRFIVRFEISADSWDGGAGTDTIDFLQSTNDIGATYNLAAGTATNAAATATEQMLNFENLRGTNNRDIIIGTNTANVLEANGGDDELYGNNGADELYGGNGNDYMSGGNDADYMSGGGQNDVFFGGGGVDIMIGGAGNDEYYVGPDDVNDIIVEYGGEGNDRIFASVSYSLPALSEIETISTDSNAGVAAINLTGSDQANIIIGNAGVNLLDGRGGNDILYGLGGVDYFAFSSTPNGATNIDTIADFTTADDTIFLDDAIFTALTAGFLASGAFRSGNGAQSASNGAEQIIHDALTGDLYYDADGAGGLAAVRFANIGVGTSIFNYDFFVY